MVPYPGEISKQTLAMRVFNKLFSSARTYSEQAWGILVNRFRILYSTMGFKGSGYVARTYKVVRACMLLHNILREMKDPIIEEEEEHDALERAQMGGAVIMPSGEAERDALARWAVDRYTLNAAGALQVRQPQCVL